MQVTTFEGIVENGQIRLKSDIHLPDNTVVYVVVPGYETRKIAHIYSPRLLHPSQAGDFEKEVVEEQPDAGL
jgi:hypothetical protein